MSGAASENSSAAFCADLVRNHDFENYATTLLAPLRCRRALLALYAFNVEIVRVREQITQPLPGEIRLQWWLDVLVGAGHGGVEGNPVAAELLLAIRDHGLPVERLSRLIEAHQFDLYNDPMPDLAALEQYLFDTSCALFSFASCIVGHQSDKTDHLARHAGLARGIAQVIAMLGFDASRRQSYVPLQLMEQHGSALEQVFAGRDTPPLRAALSGLADEARSHLDAALALLPELPPESRTVYLPLALVRPALKRMAQANVDPFVPQAASRLHILWTLWRASRTTMFRA
ncbi:Squalene/phytoene synthase [Nitrobacter hamburgensis X14]|uniref:Squalene/phytoene synthase n=1 Tax=Nitrobacter hamburgensis (strain DSM 10229 / NCIMB 13809 / X14) TaxID=323097 RepID=Q1QMD1_NITHX|nr:phytoene/squalene synthase family protein [Nitrobacter hamburgensis]ABE62616.1 Squalene/phytoene synthase [Nitrobacter hamburgensis X14]